MARAQVVVELQQLAQTQHHQTQAALVVTAHQLILHGALQHQQVKTLVAHIGTQVAAAEQVVTQASKAQQVMAAVELVVMDRLTQPLAQLIQAAVVAAVK